MSKSLGKNKMKKLLFSLFAITILIAGFVFISEKSNAQSAVISINDRIVVSENVNVRIEPNGSLLGVQYKDVLFSGFRQFGPAKGVVIDGPRLEGGYTWVKVNYDYGPDGWSAIDYLTPLGQITGWDFTGNNLLGRKIQPRQGSLFVEAYYGYVENGQVSIPSEQARAALPAEALSLIGSVQGAWSCEAISDAPPFRWVGYRCKFGRGNQPPTIVSFNGQTSAVQNVQGTWRFQATDPEGALASYKIDWGDGSPVTPVVIDGASATKDAAHTYTRAGSFNMKLTVTDAGGLFAEATFSVQVTAPCSTRFMVGDRVQVINAGAENPLNVRSSPEIPANRDANKLGGHYAGDTGSVVSGPQSANGYCWWNINYDTAPDGWSAEGSGTVFWLSKIGSNQPSDPTDPNAPNPNTNDPGASNPPPSGLSGSTSLNLAVGDYIRVASFLGARVRSSPGGALIGAQAYGVSGQIKQGPQSANGLTWWYIDYTYSTVDGWTAERDETGAAMLSKSFAPPSDDIPEPPPEELPPTGNAAPVLAPLTQPNTTEVNVQQTWQISATDTDSQNLTYTVNWGDGTANSTYNGSSGQNISIYHTYTQEGNKTITVTVSDGQSTDTETLNFSVNPPGAVNNKPAVPIITGPTQVTQGVNTSWQVLFSDPDGDTLTFTVNWEAGSTDQGNAASGETINISHTFNTVGTKAFSVVVSDGVETEYRTFTVSVVAGAAPPNSAPVISILTGPTQTPLATPQNWQVMATDADGDSLTYVISWGDQTSFTGFGASGQTLTVSHTYQTLGLKTLRATVSDSKGATVSQSILVNVGSAPVSNIVITAPVAGEVWDVYQTKSIKWNAPLSVSKVFIYLRIGSSIALITPQGAPTVNGAGTYNWTIQPTAVTSAGTFTLNGLYKIQIIAENGTHTAVSNEFTIRNTGVKFAAGDRVRVTGAGNVYLTMQDADYARSAGAHGSGALGTIKTGVPSKLGTTYYEEVDFDQAPDGFFKQDLLMKSTNKFNVNDRVEVLPSLTTSLAVRSAPNGTWIGGVYPLSRNGTKGTVLEGPTEAGGYKWWKIAWDSTITGWSAEDFVVKSQ